MFDVKTLRGVAGLVILEPVKAPLSRRSTWIDYSRWGIVVVFFGGQLIYDVSSGGGWPLSSALSLAVLWLALGGAYLASRLRDRREERHQEPESAGVAHASLCSDY